MNKPFPVEVQPPEHVREYVAMVLEGEFTADELRFVVYNDTQAHEWLPTGGYEPTEESRMSNTIEVGDTVQWRHRFLYNSQRLRSGTVIELNGASMLTVQPKNKRTKPVLVHRSQIVTTKAKS